MDRPRLGAATPRPGMTRALSAAAELAGIPGTIITVWTRFRSGESLVTLEYAPPVKLRTASIQHLEVFMRELQLAADIEPIGERTRIGHDRGDRAGCLGVTRVHGGARKQPRP